MFFMVFKVFRVVRVVRVLYRGYRTRTGVWVRSQGLRSEVSKIYLGILGCERTVVLG
jgi:hypothetical protein